jgi:hypothetical protein
MEQAHWEPMEPHQLVAAQISTAAVVVVAVVVGSAAQEVRPLFHPGVVNVRARAVHVALTMSRVTPSLLQAAQPLPMVQALSLMTLTLLQPLNAPQMFK